MNEKGNHASTDDDRVGAARDRFERAIRVLEQKEEKVSGVGNQAAWDTANPHITGILLEAAYARLKNSRLLPTPARTAIEVYRVASDEKSTLDDLVEAVQMDPAISSRLIQLANCPLYRRRKKVIAITEATQYLGRACAIKIALGVSIIDGTRVGPCPQFDYEGYWSESAAQAVTAEDRAERTDIPGGEAFVAGLLCQVGRLAFATAQPKRYAVTLRESPGRGYTLADAEKRGFQINHCELAELMMRDWGLPGWFYRAVRYQYPEHERIAAPSDGREGRLRKILRCSSTFAGIMATGEATMEVLGTAGRQAHELDIKSEELPGWYDKIGKKWHAIGEVLSVKTNDGPDWPGLCVGAQ